MADVIGNIQSLIDAANRTTGKADRDMTAAAKSLMAGYGTAEGENDFDALLSRSGTVIHNKTVKKIGLEACQNYTSLVEFYGDSVETIGQYAFRGCVALVKAEFPKLVQISDFRSFSNTGLQQFACGQMFRRFAGLLTFEAAPMAALIIRADCVVGLRHYNIFSKTPMETGGGYIYVPRKWVGEYQRATNWVQYADRIRAIEDYPEITGG